MQVGTVVFLLIGPVRKYAFVLVYCLLQLITSLLEVGMIRKFGQRSRQYSMVFWTDEIVLDLLLFLILILLTYRAMEGSPAAGGDGPHAGRGDAIAIGAAVCAFQGSFRQDGVVRPHQPDAEFRGGDFESGAVDGVARVAEEG